MRRATTVGVAAALAFACAPFFGATANAATGATFSGTVTTAADGAPAGHICVVAVKTVDSTVAGNTLTANDGTYSLTVPAGSYWLKYDDCRGGDLIEQYWKGAAIAIDATKLDVADGSALDGLNVAMVLGGAISGTATDTAGNPISVLVSALAVDQNWSATPPMYGSNGSDGTFTIHGVTPSTYQIGFSVNTTGNGMQWWYGDVREAKDSTSVSVTAGSVTSGIVAHIPHPATVSGTVRGDDGTPYANACVGVYYDTDEVVAPVQGHTATDGTYSLPDVAPGPVRVKFNDCSGVTAAQWYQGAADYASATVVDLPDGGTASSIDGVVPRGLSISGTVVDENNQSVSNAIVDVYDALTGQYTGRSVWTDSSGHYAVNGLRGATYKLLVRPSDGLVARWWPASPTSATAVPLVLTPGVSLSDIDVVVPHGASVSGTIVDESGQPVKGACVQPIGGIGDQRPNYAITDEAGHYTATGLDVGTYNFELSSCDQADVARSWLGGTDVRSTATSVTVDLGQIISGIDAVAHPGGDISGTVRDTSGNPLTNICVHAELGGAGGLTSTPEAFTDSSGHYAFHELWPRDDYVLRFDDCYTGKYVATYLGGMGTATHVSVTAHADTTGNDVMLYRAGFLTGTVIDQFGHRVARVNVGAVSNNNGTDPVLTDDSGNFRIGGLLPGTYSVSYYDGGAGLFRDPVTGRYTNSNVGATFDVTEGNATAVPQAQVTVITTPSAPVSVNALAGDGSALVSWVAPSDTGHSPLTGFQVRLGDQILASAGGAAHSVLVPHLANYRSYSLTVDAVNLRGASASSAAVTVVPKPAAAITLIRHPAAVVYGGKTALSGRLTLKSTGAPLAQRVVALFRRAHGTARWIAVTSTPTTSTGHYSFSVRPLRSMDYRVSYAGTRNLLPAVAIRTVGVTPQLRLTKQGASLIASVTPVQVGRPVELEQLAGGSWRAVSTKGLSRTGHVTFTLSHVGVYRTYVRATSRFADAWGRRLTVTSL